MKNKKNILIISGILISLSFLLKYLNANTYFSDGFMIAASIAAGYQTARNAIVSLKYKVLGIEALVTVAVVGAIFIGEYSCESAGDYAVGPSHVLPTASIAKFRAGLSVLDFIKMPSVQKLNKEGFLFRF